MAISVSRRFIFALALPALMACQSLGLSSDAQVSGTRAGGGTLDAAIEAAGGAAALGKVKELGWTGTAKVTADGKTSEIQLEATVRPFTFARISTWPKGERKGVRTIQAEHGSAWVNERFSWIPVPEAQAVNENQQMALYSMMVLAGLKDPAAKVTESAPARDGTRTLHVEHPKAPPTDLKFDKAGKLVGASNSVRDPAGGPAPVQQTVAFSGEMTSNGVKWPKRITIQRNGQPYMDLELATFEARPEFTTAPIPETLGEQDTNAPN
jgi:hypothetical protein